MERTRDTMGPFAHRRRRDPRSRKAFTLLEMLVVMSIISMLLALLVPAAMKVRRGMTKLKCASNMRSVTLAFQFFADGTSEEGQGDSERLGPSRFFVNDFQDDMYRIDEYWDLGEAPTGTLDTASAPMLCPAGPDQLTKRRGFPCGREAVGPVEDVTLAVNMRLYRSVVEVGDMRLLAPVAATRVRSTILNHPYVPLVIDMDGKEASLRGLDPFYIAPGRPGTDDPYSTGRYWMPSDRHDGKTNVAFVGGHVLSSAHPETERWNWDYQAHVGR